MNNRLAITAKLKQTSYGNAGYTVSKVFVNADDAYFFITRDGVTKKVSIRDDTIRLDVVDSIPTPEVLNPQLIAEPGEGNPPEVELVVTPAPKKRTRKKKE